ncbi:MAG TPA: glycosyltransferase family 4 protein [Gemmatimonadales bacterium]|nr:glycosyltransferase family 4 protein [Gemmatimonadales bacterium]
MPPPQEHDVPLNIAVVAACPFPASRGTPIRIQRLAEAMAARRHRVHVVTYHYGSGEADPELTVHRIGRVGTYRRLAPGPTYIKLALLDPLLTIKLRQVLRRYPIDVIHAHHFEGLLVGQAARIGTRIPLVFDAHTLLTSELPLYRLGLPIRAKRFIAAAFDLRLPVLGDHVVTVTERIRDRLLERHPMWADKISVIQNGADLHLFPSVGGKTRGAAASPTLIFTGNLAAYQGIDLLLQAFRRVLDARADVRLKIVTDSSFDQYEARARELGIRSAIDVLQTPFREIPQQLADATLALNPRTDCDGIPVKLLNYMAARKPVVSFAGCAPGIRHRETAWLVPDGDVEAFAAGALTLIENTELADALGTSARRFVEAHHSWDHSAEKLEHIFRRLVERAGQVGRS